MKKYIFTFMFIFTMICFVKCQNYLYNPGESGLSVGVGLFSPNAKTINGYSGHLDYTFNGRFSVGISRTMAKSNYSNTFDDKFSTFNISFSPIKIQKPKSIFSTPLVFSYSNAEDFDVISFGGGISFISQINNDFKAIPLFLILYSKPTSVYSSSYLGFGFELNLIYQKLRITPSISVAENNSSFGLDVGFVF